MSAIIQKLHELSKLNVTLPISNTSVEINKINLDLQSKFEQFATNVDNELQSSMQYLEFINRHIRKEVGGDVDFLDKLFILQQWHNDLKAKPIKHEFSPISIKDLTLKINGADFLFKFELPSIVKDLAFLKYILDKQSDLASVDVLFYFTFRNLQSVTIDNEMLEVSDIPLAETLFKLLDINKVGSINKHIDTALKPIESVRNLEVDARVFFT